MIVEEDFEKFIENFSKYFLDKNQEHGDAIITQTHIFGGGNAFDRLGDQIDIIIGRIQRSKETYQQIKKKDMTKLVGFLVLWMLYKGWIDFEDLVD